MRYIRIAVCARKVRETLATTSPHVDNSNAPALKRAGACDAVIGGFPG